MDTAHINILLNIATVIFGGGAVAYWIKGMPERARVTIERANAFAKIEADLRNEAVKRFGEFRTEVHDLRNELQRYVGDLAVSEANRRRGSDKLSMMAFVLQLVMGELRRLDPNSQTLDQAERLLKGVIDEPDENGKTDKLKKAEHAVAAARDTVVAIKHDEAEPEDGA